MRTTSMKYFDVATSPFEMFFMRPPPSIQGFIDMHTSHIVNEGFKEHLERVRREHTQLSKMIRAVRLTVAEI